VEQCPFRQVNSASASEEICLIYGTRSFITCVYSKHTLVPIPSKVDAVHALQFFFSCPPPPIYTMIFQVVLSFSFFPPKYCTHFSSPKIRSTCSTYLIIPDLITLMSGRSQTTGLFIMEISGIFWTLSVLAKISSSALYCQTPSAYSSCKARDRVSHIQSNRPHDFAVNFNLHNECNINTNKCTVIFFVRVLVFILYSFDQCVEYELYNI
jgi:hypothetical protein